MEPVKGWYNEAGSEGDFCQKKIQILLMFLLHLFQFDIKLYKISILQG